MVEQWMKSLRFICMGCFSEKLRKFSPSSGGAAEKLKVLLKLVWVQILEKV